MVLGGHHGMKFFRLNEGIKRFIPNFNDLCKIELASLLPSANNIEANDIGVERLSTNKVT